jgi:hypothetical protein
MLFGLFGFKVSDLLPLFFYVNLVGEAKREKKEEETTCL